MSPNAALICALAGACALAPCIAQAGEQGVGLAGQAPVVCVAGIRDGGAEAPMGRLTEFCNDPAGYEIWIDYPAELAGAQLVVGSERRTLTVSGEVRVSRASGPGKQERALQLEGASPGQTRSLIVRVQPASAGEATVAAR